MRLLAILALALVSGCAHQDPWTKSDTALYSLYIGTLAADTYTTTRFQYHDCIVEINPVVRSVLGDNPKTSDAWQASATMAVTNLFVARALPEKWRDWYLSGWAAGHGVAAFHNHNLLKGDPCR